MDNSICICGYVLYTRQYIHMREGLIYMNIHILVCTYVHAYIDLQHKYIHIHIQVYACTYHATSADTEMETHALRQTDRAKYVPCRRLYACNVRGCMYRYICIQVHICICICKYIRVYEYVCTLYIYIYLFMNTYME